MTTIDLWFDFASTYSYLSISRIEAFCEERSLSLRWKPFLLGTIFNDQGWSNSPFVLYPAKGQYMWRDMERCAAKYGLPFVKPSSFPRNGLLAARVTLAALKEPWVNAFIKAVFTAEFAFDQDISSPEVISRILKDLKVDPQPWLSLASTPEIKNELRVNTDQAKSLGIFGAPTFVVGGELFWGNDRLEDALATAASV